MPAARCSPTIQVLPGEVVSRIAAGEVIERPAAVVKELIENSLDAGSRHIVVDIKDGGRSLIRVTDDGEGIRRADLLLAFERHATSKLRSDDDLASIRTMGFRGEALPSIAAVSRVQVHTAVREDAVGAQLSLIGGVPQGIADAPPVVGTRIGVEDLFFNQPARKKFLKSVPTEFSHISAVVQQAALAWPSVHFRLAHNGHDVLHYAGVDEASVYLYLQPDPTVPLLIDTGGDSKCDALNTQVTPALPFQVLKPVAPTGSSYSGATGAVGGAAPIDCPFRGDSTRPEFLCNGFSDMTRVINFNSRT